MKLVVKKPKNIDPIILALLISLREMKDKDKRIQILDSLSSNIRGKMLVLLEEAFGDNGAFVDIAAEASPFQGSMFSRTIDDIDKNMLKELYKLL